MIFEQYYLKCLAHASYLIGDETSHTAVVVDPQRDVDQYLDDAARHGLTIRHVFLTHFHADFVAGHLELRDRAGATIRLGARAKAEYAFVPMADGDELTFGRVRLRVLETPGHSPESIAIVVYDLEKDPGHPYAVLTGDTLFIGDVGRPDLRASLGFSATELGGLLYDSLHRKLLALPDDTLVYPTHGAGSLCGKSLSSERVSTIGIQRQYNYALRPMSREQFIEVVTAEQPDAPAYFTYDAVLNTREHATLDRALESALVPLGLADLLVRQRSGAQLLDVRPAGEFMAGHLAGSLNIGLDGQFATWAGTLLRHDAPILLVAPPGREVEAATRLGRIGFDHVAGYLEGGIAAASDESAPIRQLSRLAATTVAEMLATDAPPVLLDVRAPAERREQHIEGTRHIPLTQLRDRLSELPANRPVVTYCAGGYRSAVAASLLRAHGVAEVSDLLGGLTGWQQSGLPVAGGDAGTHLRPTEYQEQVAELPGGAVRVTSYKLGTRYYGKVENLDPGACLARVEGVSRGEVTRSALEQAGRLFARTRQP